MSERTRLVKVEATIEVEVEHADSPGDARAEAALRVKKVLDNIYGKTPGVAVGTSGGYEKPEGHDGQ